MHTDLFWKTQINDAEMARSVETGTVSAFPFGGRYLVYVVDLNMAVLRCLPYEGVLRRHIQKSNK